MKGLPSDLKVSREEPVRDAGGEPGQQRDDAKGEGKPFHGGHAPWVLGSGGEKERAPRRPVTCGQESRTLIPRAILAGGRTFGRRKDGEILRGGRDAGKSVVRRGPKKEGAAFVSIGDEILSKMKSIHGKAENWGNQNKAFTAMSSTKGEKRGKA